MDDITALKVSKYQIDPETLKPYKEVKSKSSNLEGSVLPVRMGKGGLSSLQNMNKIVPKGS